MTSTLLEFHASVMGAPLWKGVQEAQKYSEGPGWKHGPSDPVQELVTKGWILLPQRQLTFRSLHGPS